MTDATTTQFFMIAGMQFGIAFFITMAVLASIFSAIGGTIGFWLKHKYGNL